MKFVRKYIYIIYFIALFLNFIIWDYFRYETFNWIENTLQSLVTVLFYLFFRWAWNSKDYSKKKDYKQRPF